MQWKTNNTDLSSIMQPVEIDLKKKSSSNVCNNKQNCANIEAKCRQNNINANNISQISSQKSRYKDIE